MKSKLKENKFLYYTLGCFGCFGIVVFAGIIFGGCVLLFGSNDNTDEDVIKTEQISTKDSSSNDEKEEQPKINDTNVTIEDVNFKITSTEFNKTVAGYSSDEQYLIVELQVKNNSKESYTVNNSDFVLIIDGAEFEIDSTTTAYYDGGFFLEKINPSISKTASVVFEIPKDLKGKQILLQVQPNKFKNNKGLINIK